MVKRLYVEKKKDYNIEAQKLFDDIIEVLGINKLASLRLINRYDVSGLDEKQYVIARNTVFAEPMVDNVYDESVEIPNGSRVFAVEYLPGQYDQRADSASQCIQLLTEGEKPEVKTAKMYILDGDITDVEFDAIKKYLINPVESREAQLMKPDTLADEINIPDSVKTVCGFIDKSNDDLKKLMDSMGLAMSFDDVCFLQKYFKDTEHRDPTVTEIRAIDTYWSDHCRHTTFLTDIKNVSFEDGKFVKPIEDAYKNYIKIKVNDQNFSKKSMCLMDIATIAMKELKKHGKIQDLDTSGEINACSLVADVDVNGKNQKWLIQFKNETHNHPTEIEPFGGAATCLGGAIRDPLSGRAYVYQAMRITGSGDPRCSLKDTLHGKLPQRKITTGAASGYSSYGNQIGLATGHVEEVYDPGYVAKRMEIGAVIGAVPLENIRRVEPETGDIVILLGGRTGRDGCGGATGSSKEHNENSLMQCGAEVQKGNPPTERKLQRLLRNPDVRAMIKRCNDFGAGGVCVAIGELADGLHIDLDLVPKKYEGLDGTELAISESQERMAVVIAKDDKDRFIQMAHKENLEATKVAEVTDDRRLQMTWKGNKIVDITRDFLNTNGAKQYTDVCVKAPDQISFFDRKPSILENGKDLKTAWLDNLSDLNVCSQKGLVERFDSTIGASTVLMPYGGKYQLTPSESMAAKVPVLHGDTTTCTIMSHGYNPELSKWSPFHGAAYSVIQALSKIVAAGGEYSESRLTFQEYFEKPGTDAKSWGKPFSALLGAMDAQLELGIPAIGGKDSMSGTFNDMNVPPTLVTFAVDITNVKNIISSEFKKIGSTVVNIPLPRKDNGLPDYNEIKKIYSRITELIREHKIISAYTVRAGGIAETIAKMAFGNKIGFKFDDNIDADKLFSADIGSFVTEIDGSVDILSDIEYIELGKTQEKPSFNIGNTEISIEDSLSSWENPLESVFPTKIKHNMKSPVLKVYVPKSVIKASNSYAKPRVFIPVFPGTNCEYDSAAAFEKAGAAAETCVFRNLDANDINGSMNEFIKRIRNSQIIMIPGGFSAGDEPDGSGKFITAVFRNPYVKDAVMDLIKNRDGLMLGICNGFQALIKLGLVPYGEIRDMDSDMPTLTFNTIGRHVSRMVMTKVVSKKSPWLLNVSAGEVFNIPVSHGEGRFVAPTDVINKLIQNGQVATQYVDYNGDPSMSIEFNPNGSYYAIEGITSPDGRILGKMGHSERHGENVAINIEGNKDQKIFESGVEYFK